MNLIYRGKRTVAFYKLRESATAEGAVSKYGRYSTEHTILQNLLKAGLVEMRASGPRGGSRYHATAAGVAFISVEALAPFEVAA